ncbi:MAG: hypothetical protein AAF471_06840 [Myxococcota bacterium]
MSRFEEGFPTLSFLRKQESILERSANFSSEKQPIDLFGSSRKRESRPKQEDARNCENTCPSGSGSRSRMSRDVHRVSAASRLQKEQRLRHTDVLEKKNRKKGVLRPVLGARALQQRNGILLPRAVPAQTD